MASTTPVSFTFTLFALNRKLASSIDIDEEHTNRVTLCFISLMSSVGTTICNAIQQVIVSLLTKFLETNGFNYDNTTRSGGNGPANPSVNC